MGSGLVRNHQPATDQQRIVSADSTAISSKINKQDNDISQSPQKQPNQESQGYKKELHFPQIQTPKSNQQDLLFSFDNRFKVNGMQLAIAESAFSLHK